MKKILSILSNISLSTIITTNIIACQQPNTNKQNDKSIEPQFTPQQPPTNSNWKLIDKKNYSNEIKNINNKWYIVIFQKNTKDWYIINFLNNSKNDKILGTFLFDDVRQNVYLSDLRSYFKNSNIKTIYRWNGIGKPQIPSIDNSTGEITNWNEKI